MSRNSYEQPPKDHDDAPWSPPTSDSSNNPSSGPDPITPRYESDYLGGAHYSAQLPPGAQLPYPQLPHGNTQAGGYLPGSPGPSPYIPSPPYFPQKSRATTAVLAFFFGIVGAHNFYLGRTGIATAQLLLSVLSLCLLSWVTAIWAFIEMILYLVGNSPRWSTDAYGVPLR